MEKTVKNKPLTYNVCEKYVTALQNKYPPLKVTTCGKSLLGRDIYGLVVGEGSENILYLGALHGSDWIVSLMLLEFCENLLYAMKLDGELSGYRVTQILQNKRLIIVPEVNPDGVEIALNGVCACGEYANTDFKSCNGDFGKWRANGRGVDIDRNFNFNWYALHETECKRCASDEIAQICGAYPESEPETYAVTRLCRNIPIEKFFVFQGRGEAILCGNQKRISEKSRTMARAFAGVSGYEIQEKQDLNMLGGVQDWFAQEFKKPAFKIKIGKNENTLSLSNTDDIYKRTEALLVMGLVL